VAAGGRRSLPICRANAAGLGDHPDGVGEAYLPVQLLLPVMDPDRRYEAGQVSYMYRLLLAFLALPLLLLDAQMQNALAAPATGQGHSSHVRSVHSRPVHAASSRHHVRAPVRGTGTLGPQLHRSKSEWQQAQRRGNVP
jgi:hypothetical protein